MEWLSLYISKKCGSRKALRISMTCFRYSPFYIWINTISCSFSKINIMTNNVLDDIISERIEEKYAVLKE